VKRRVWIRMVGRSAWPVIFAGGQDGLYMGHSQLLLLFWVSGGPTPGSRKYGCSIEPGLHVPGRV